MEEVTQEANDIHFCMNSFAFNLQTVRLLFNNAYTAAKSADEEIFRKTNDDYREILETHIMRTPLDNRGKGETREQFIERVYSGPLVDELFNYRKTPNKNLDTLLIGLFLSLNSYFEYLLHDLLFYCYNKYPKFIGVEKINISINELSKFSSIEQATKILSQKKSYEILDKISYNELLDRLSKVEIYLDKSLIDIDFLKEIRERRNLIVHRKSIIDVTYIERSKNPFNLKEGEKALITEDYFVRVLKEIELAGIVISLNSWAKYNIENEDISVLEKLLRICYWETVDENYELVQKLHLYSRKFKTDVKEEQDKIVYMKMLYLLGLKRVNSIDKLKRELARINFDSLSLLNKINCYILQNSFVKAISLIKKACAQKLITVDGYNESPIYRELRDDKKLNKKIEKILIDSAPLHS